MTGSGFRAFDFRVKSFRVLGFRVVSGFKLQGFGFWSGVQGFGVCGPGVGSVASRSFFGQNGQPFAYSDSHS